MDAIGDIRCFFISHPITTSLYPCELIYNNLREHLKMANVSAQQA